MHIPLVAQPTKFERENVGLIRSGYQHLVEHGTLPDTPFWHLNEFRYDLNEARYTINHPNIANIIDMYLANVTIPPDRPWPPVEPILPVCPPINPPCVPVTPCEPLNPQTVPEPTALLMGTAALAIVLVVTFLRKTR